MADPYIFWGFEVNRAKENPAEAGFLFLHRKYRVDQERLILRSFSMARSWATASASSA